VSLIFEKSADLWRDAHLIVESAERLPHACVKQGLQIPQDRSGVVIEFHEFEAFGKLGSGLRHLDHLGQDIGRAYWKQSWASRYTTV
jgi:hypothetical protein